MRAPEVMRALGGSLIAEELKGDVAAARAALGPAPDALDAAVVELLAGEVSAARALLAVPSEEGGARALVARSHFWLAGQAGVNRWPDGRGAGAVEITVRLGAHLVGGDRAALAAAVSDRDALAESTLAGDVAAMLPTVRAIVSSATRWGAAPDGLMETVLEIPARLRAIAGAPEGWLAFADRAAADLHRRAGDLGAARTLLAAALERYRGAGDAVGMAACELDRGDWLAAPYSSPDALDLAIDESASDANELDWRLEAREGDRSAADPAGAADAYASARRLLDGADAPRARAALSLRDGYLALLGDAPAEMLASARSALALFEGCGDGAGAALARIHCALAGVAAGEIPEDVDAGAAVGAWGARSGSFSHALGLGLLCSRCGRDWVLRRGDYERGLACHRIAAALFRALGAEANAVQAIVDQGRVYRAVGETPVALSFYGDALTAAEAARAARPAIAADLARREVLLGSDTALLATAGRDADALERAGQRLMTLATALLSTAPASALPGDDAASTAPPPAPASALPENDPARAMDVAAAGLAAELAVQATVMAPLYRGQRVRSEGNAEEAERWFTVAGAAAGALPEDRRDHMEAIVAATARRFPEALAAYARHEARQPADNPLVAMLRRFGGEWQAEERKERARRLDQRFAFLVGVRAWEAARDALEELLALGEEWPDPRQPWIDLSDAGTVYAELGDVARALAFYDRGIEEVEARAGRMTRDELRTTLAGASPVQLLYLGAARTALNAAERAAGVADRDALRARAFDYAERGKARALLDLIAGSAILARRPAEERGPRRAWRELTARLALHRGMLADLRGRAGLGPGAPPAPTASSAAAPPTSSAAPTPSLDEELQATIAAEEQELRALERTLAADDPRFLATVSPRAEVLSLAEAAAALPDGAVALQYVFAGEDMLAWAIGRDGMLAASHTTRDAPALAREIDALKRACRSRGDGWQEPARSLAEAFLEPFDALIDAHETLVLVPYGAAHELPFAVLPWRGRPLADSRALATLPSLSVLRHTAAAPGDPRVLAVGDPAAMAHRPPGAAEPRPYAPLRAAAAEAEYVASLFPDSIALVGAAATETAVRAAIPGHSIIHFATHGQLEPMPMASCLLLADGEVLSVYELMGIGLDADLVVLSACRTGEGTVTGGDEVVGFTRALLGAGARAAVVSLWSVDDESTCLLMRAFYDALAAGARPPAALAAAQRHLQELEPAAAGAERAAVRAAVSRGARDMLGADPVPDVTLSHPYHWAPFVVVGVDAR